MKPTLIESDFARAARALGTDVPAVKAVCEVEAPRGGFLPDGRPTILYERHIFSRLTKGVHDAKHSSISNRDPGGYKGGAAEHDRLGQAAALDRDSALRSASWGKFQIMGFNHDLAGFTVLQQFINAMYESEGRQLDAFVEFVRANPSMHTALRQHDWPTFARLYNGRNYKQNSYDTKLAAAYDKFK